jgi:hypothetical protein
MSTSKRIDGLWVGTWETGGKARTVLERVEEALRLIKTFTTRSAIGASEAILSGCG